MTPPPVARAAADIDAGSALSLAHVSGQPPGRSLGVGDGALAEVRNLRIRAR
jgi:hypothetical protein